MFGCLVSVRVIYSKACTADYNTVDQRMAESCIVLNGFAHHLETDPVNFEAVKIKWHNNRMNNRPLVKSCSFLSVFIL